MPNAAPQGIAGLMQKPQGQMPSPMNASPTAGLGSVDDRVSAYQSPQELPKLQQRYAKSQDLLDLLALQKIKSQQDMIKRQMAMQQQQLNAQNGQTGTVMEQRQKEVHDATTNELAQQVGDTEKQQTQDKQAQMQKLLGSGVASAPGAASAAQPIAMASGGIVGFADGGSVDAARKRAEEAMAKLRTFGLRQRQQDPEGYAAAEQASKQAQEALANAEREVTGGPVGVMGKPMGIATLPAAQVNPAAPPMQTGNGPTQIPSGAPAAPPPPMPAAPPPPMPAAPPKPPMPAAPPPPGAPGAAPGATPPPANDFGQKMRDASLTNVQIDPAARQLAEETRIEKKTALTPEQRGVYQEGIGGLQKMYDEQYDPERQRQEGIARALMGAGGRRYGEFAGAAAAGLNYRDAQRAAKLKEFGDIQNAKTGLIGIDRANVEKGIGAGQKAYEQNASSQRTGLETGYHLYNTDVTSRDKGLDREVERLKVQAQAAATAATREATTYAQQSAHLDTVVNNRARALEAVKKRFAPQLDMVETSLQAKPKDEALLTRRKTLMTSIEAELDAVSKPFDDSEAMIQAKMFGGSNTGGYTVKKKDTTPR